MKAIYLIVLLAFGTAAQAAQTITAHVNGMVCAFCAQGIEKKVRALPQTQDVYINLKQKVVAVEVKEGQALAPDVIAALVKDAGYDVTKIEVVQETAVSIKARLTQE
ncbi:MAG: heavy metal-associated domain-containing protein [Spongiibacteraceae bacterium]